MSGQASTIVFWMVDLELFKESLYGIGNNKNNFIRSDDDGLTWKSVSEIEFYNVNFLGLNFGFFF
jgi:hypothetical protein